MAWSSCREPAATQKPMVTEWASGMRSDTTRVPFARRDLWITEGPESPAAAAAARPVAAGTAVASLLLRGTEVAELLLGLGLEGLLERDVLAVATTAAAPAAAAATAATATAGRCARRDALTLVVV